MKKPDGWCFSREGTGWLVHTDERWGSYIQVFESKPDASGMQSFSVEPVYFVQPKLLTWLGKMKVFLDQTCTQIDACIAMSLHLDHKGLLPKIEDLIVELEKIWPEEKDEKA